MDNVTDLDCIVESANQTPLYESRSVAVQMIIVLGT